MASPHPLRRFASSLTNGRLCLLTLVCFVLMLAELSLDYFGRPTDPYVGEGLRAALALLLVIIGTAHGAKAAGLGENSDTTPPSPGSGTEQSPTA